jgi:hypothetical protein
VVVVVEVWLGLVVGFLRLLGPVWVMLRFLIEVLMTLESVPLWLREGAKCAILR